MSTVALMVLGVSPSSSWERRKMSFQRRAS